MNSALLFSVIWFLLASLSGVGYILKPHILFIVAGSGALALSLLHLGMHLCSSNKNYNH